MQPLEQYAVVRAIEKIAKDRGAELREELDQQFLDEYRDRGIKKQEVRVDGNKVGEYIVNMTKPEYVISDKALFDEFALCNGLATVVRSIDPWMMDRVLDILTDTLTEDELQEFIREDVVYNVEWQKSLDTVDGEVVLYGSNHTVPGVTYKPETPKNTQIRGCNPADVLPIVKRLGGLDQMLLGEGNAR